jgi:hypothetical protein
MRARLIIGIVIGSMAVAGVAAGAGARSAATPAKITAKGVDGVKLGRTFHAIRREGLVGRMRPGCELAPDTHSAKLLAPLKGSVDFSQSKPRTVVDISIRGGAKARGVGIGSRARAIRRAYPKAKFDHHNDAIFGTLVKVPRSGGGRLQFLVDTHTHRVTLIGVPFIAFCE